MKKKHLVGATFISCTLVSLPAFAHFGNRPVTPIGGISQLVEPNHAGYGFMSKSSEAEAGNAVDFFCRDEDIVKYTSAACAIPPGIMTLKQAKDLVKTTTTPIVTQNLREKIVEYSMYKAAALNSTRPMPELPPSCIQEGSPVRTLNVDLPSAPPTNDELETMTEQIQKMPDAQHGATAAQLAAKKEAIDKRDSLLKMRAVAASFKTGNVVSALMLADQLDYQWSHAGRNCPGYIDDDKLFCEDIDSQRARLKAAYPVIFEGSNAEVASRRKELRENVALLLGSFHASTKDTELAEASEAGKTKLRLRGMHQFYDVGVQGSIGNTGNSTLADLNSLYDQASEAAKNGIPGTCPHDKPSVHCPVAHSPLLDAAMAKINATVDDMKKEQEKTVLADLDSVCKGSLEDLVKKFPQATRQMLLEQSGPELSASQATLCSCGLNKVIQRGIENSCIGVKGSLSGSGVTVHRTAYSFPFNSTSNYKVTRSPDGKLHVSMTVTFEKVDDPHPAKGDSAFTNDDFNKLTKGWVGSVGSWYNSQAGKQTPPLDPPVDFTMNAASGTSGEPHVYVSKCYNRSLPENQQHDCSAVKATLTNGGSYADSKTGDWQDSGDLTASTDADTLHHEFGHTMGLPDEYIADYYPFNEIGEHDSVMNGAEGGTNPLYRRHFEEILRPALMCGSK